MKKRTRKNNSKSTIGVFIILIIIVAGIVFILYDNSKANKTNNTNKVTKENVSNNTSEKKNYDFYGRNIVCDDFISGDDNEAMYIVDGDIYYIKYENNNYSSYKIVTNGVGVGEEDGNIVGYIDSSSVIDENYALVDENKKYVTFRKTNTSQKEEETTTQSDGVFEEYSSSSDAFYRGSGYAGASSKAVQLKNGTAYFLQYDGDNLVNSQVIATNVKKIANLGTDKSSTIVVYIDKDTIISDDYKSYEISKDDNGDEYILIC